MDEHPERSLCLSREPAIAGSNAVADRSSRWSIRRYPGRCGSAHMLIRWTLLRKCFYLCVKFSWLVSMRNYFNSEIFPIYGKSQAVGIGPPVLCSLKYINHQLQKNASVSHVKPVLSTCEGPSRSPRKEGISLVHFCPAVQRTVLDGTPCHPGLLCVWSKNILLS